MTLTFATSASSSAVAKSSGAAVVTKKKRGDAVLNFSDESDDEETRAGVILTFTNDEGNFQAHICKDPIFASVDGFQSDASFLKATMVDFIKSELSKKFPEHDYSAKVHPLLDDDAHVAVRLHFVHRRLRKRR